MLYQLSYSRVEPNLSGGLRLSPAWGIFAFGPQASPNRGVSLGRGNETGGQRARDDGSRSRRLSPRRSFAQATVTSSAR
jgi:hypothetical protein